MNLKTLCILALACSSATLSAQKKPLDQSAYDGWKSIASPRISDNGDWICYSITPQRGDALLEFYNTQTGNVTRIERGNGAALFNNGTWASFKIAVPFDSVRKAKIAKVKADKMPKDTFAVMNLADMKVIKLDGVKSVKTAPKGALYAYTYEVNPVKDTADTAKKAKKYDRLVIVNLQLGDSTVVDSVKNFQVAENGASVLYTREADSLKSVCLYSVDPKNGVQLTELWSSKLGQIASSMALDKWGTQGAFMVTSDTVKHALYDLYYFATADLKARKIANEQIVGLPGGFAVSKFGNLAFNRDGNRLQFGIAPKPKEEPKDTLPADEKFSLDVWSYRDTVLMPMQLVNKKRIAEANYMAVYFPKEKRALALGDIELPSITFAENGDAPYAIGTTSRPYSLYTGEDIQMYNPSDVYLIDLKSGKRTLIRKGGYGGTYLSPSAKYAAYYNLPDSSWYAIDTKTLKHTRLTADIPYPFYNIDDDHPGTPPLYGMSGWTTDEKMLIPDQFDLWLVDPAGKEPAQNLTKIGREKKTQFRFVNMSRVDGKSVVDLSRPMMFLSFNRENKENGYYLLQPGQQIQKLVEGPYIYAIVGFAREGDRLIYTRENFNEFRDLWTSNEQFGDAKKLTNANPQQADYKWGSVELFKWTDFNGNECEGLLHFPEDYDPSRPYPTIVYFYETQTFLRYRYNTPAPSRSIINPVYCTSNGYVVFIPDIKYRDGHPGKSCYDIVVSGTMALIERGIADKDHIGLQGQSWGGYQTAYLVTQSDLYACSAPGAAVTNMFSAYGGIRYESGRSRASQYETGQSRIGATPWKRPDLYIENSSVFFADRVKTPQLLRHDDNDGAVPWTQSIEYYIALRRLGRPVWLLNYNGEPHNLASRAACMDWDKRMYQFFDHYLKDAPMPRWMKEGIHLRERGIDQKYDLLEK